MKNQKKAVGISLALFIGALTLTGCASSENTNPAFTASSAICTESTGALTTTTSILAANSTLHTSEEDYEWSDADVQELVLSGESVTISEVGTYRLTGEISDGQILVDTSATGIVRLVLDGVTISNSTGSAIEITNAPETMIVLASGSKNKVSDTSNYEADVEANAAIFAKSNLTITGKGELVVNANGNDGISTKDGLVINSGNITVTSVDDAIRGKDYVVVEGGTITITSGGDGIKSDNDETNTRGFINVSGGTVTIDSETDGAQATTDVVVTGGSLNVSAVDDALNSSCVTAISGGNISASAGDDAVHSDGELFISAGTISVEEAYEGLEAAAAYVSGGNIYVNSSDDGINIAGGADGSGEVRPGEEATTEETTTTEASGDAFSTSVDTQITISGGIIVINSGGDGLDTNAIGTITGGNITVYGPTNGGNGAMDGDFTISGGTLLSIGSAGMAIAPSVESSQASIKATLTTPVNASQILTIKNSSGTVLATFKTSKAIESVVYSSSRLKIGETYNVFAASENIGSGVAGEYENNEFGGRGMGGGMKGPRPSDAPPSE